MRTLSLKKRDTNRDVEVKPDETTQGGTLPDGGFWFDTIDFLSVDDFSLTNGKNIRYENRQFTIDEADTITINDGVLTLIKNFDGDNVNSRIESADQVQIRCLVLDDVERTDFYVLSDRTRAEPDKDVTLFITDCAYTQNTFTSDNDGGVTITENEPIRYTLESGRLVYESATHRDILETETASSITFDYFDGFQCAQMSPKASYFYVDKLDSRKDFAVKNPSFGKAAYELCLRRMSAKTFPEADGTADFIDNKISLNKP